MPAKKRASSKTQKVVPFERRLSIAWRNLLLFLVLFAVSLIFYRFSVSDFYTNLFGLLSIVTGFLAFAFLVIVVLLKIVNKK